MDDGYSATGLIERIDHASNDIALDLEELEGRKVTAEDGYLLINALYFLRQDVEEAISKLDIVLNDAAVV